MEGRTVSHYRVIERLGGGGMGVVYKATDTKLGRVVALKFLPPDLTRDDEARQRLIQEAKTASALDHPNICTVYDIDSTPEGQLFIVMSFYDGETLKKRIARGSLAVDECLDVAIQIAHGLTKAHEAGIIHRDIKPANLIATRDGAVKIVDFGIAKLTGSTGLTVTGVTLGTVAYMSPEQINGDMVDQRTDIWALGVVLYEMLAGRPPFGSEHELTVVNGIVRRDPAPLNSLRSDVPPALARIVDRALRKKPEERYQSAAELARELSECRTRLADLASPVGQSWRAFARPKVAAVMVLALVALAYGAGWFWNRSAKARWAREQLPEISRLVEADKYGAAFVLADQVDPWLAGDAALQELWPRMSRTIAITTRPPGAHVYTKDYADPNDPWRELGVTPLANLRVPIGFRRWRFAKEGFATIELAGEAGGAPVGPLRGLSFDVSLEDVADPNMVHVDGKGAVGASWITGIDPIAGRVTMPDFFIDKYEVTNRQFKLFLDADGYRKREYWDQPFVADGKSLTWEQATSRLVDATGRPGPATWRLGDYPTGQDNSPVTGVSWYEAAAFAKFSGKSLPTVTHWVLAAGTWFAASISPLSNLQGASVAPVGKFGGMSPYGAYDMAGNVREWCWNAWGGSRYILGGAWPDPPYTFTYANVQSPFDRSATNGIRLIRSSSEVPAALAKPVELLARDYAKEKPVNDEVFNAYRSQFSYDPAPLNATVEQASGGTKDYHIEKVTFDAAYGHARMIVYLVLPTSSSAPYQGVIGFPGSSAIAAPFALTAGFVEGADFVMKGGRALVLPVYRGTFERREGLSSTWPDQSDRYREFVISWVRDVKRTIDYLETRRDIDAGRLAYLGTSWGGRMGAIIPAVEPRIKTVILNSGGLSSGKARPEVDQLNYITRVTQPVLMLNGRYDAIEPVDSAQRPMFDMLGTPKDRKKSALYDDDHMVPAHRNEVAREALDWLDRYLGPVK